MSRIPGAEWVRVVEQVRSVESFAEKVELAQKSAPKPMAALIALQYEAAAVINRLAVLVDRGGNTLLIDKAANVMQHWNQAVREAGVLIEQ